ncbi:MAG: TolC family protein [Bacteroidales bacterium]|nr:TolC family protein [Bacteroidales bacterium]
MIRKLFLAVLLFVLPTILLAQQKWTLRQCVEYAIENNINLKQQEVIVNQSDLAVKTNQYSRLPDLNVGMGQNFSFGRSTNVATQISESQNSLSSSLNVHSSIPLFTGFRIPNEIKAGKLDLLAAVEGLNKAKENLEIQVTTYFLEVLFEKELLKIAEEQVEQTQEQVEKTRILYEGDKVPLAQLYDIKAQLANDELNRQNAQNNLESSLLDLAQALNLRDVSQFDVQEPQIGDVITENISSILPPEEIYQQAVQIKPHIKEASYRLEGEKRRLKVAQAAYWPTLSFSMSYNTGYGRRAGAENIIFKRQLKDNSSEVLGFSLNIPIFNRFQTRNRVKEVRLSLLNRNLELDYVKQTFFKEIQQAYQSAIASQTKYDYTVRALEAAKEAYQYAQEKYNVGRSTVVELNEAKLKYITSQSEQVQAKYDFLFRAKILDFYRGYPIRIE